MVINWQSAKYADPTLIYKNNESWGWAVVASASVVAATTAGGVQGDPGDFGGFEEIPKPIKRRRIKTAGGLGPFRWRRDKIYST